MTKAPSEEPKLDFEPTALEWARKKAGLTKRAAAERAGISEQYWGDLEAGRRNLRPDTLITIAAALNCPVVVLEVKREVAP